MGIRSQRGILNVTFVTMVITDLFIIFIVITSSGGRSLVRPSPFPVSWHGDSELRNRDMNPRGTANGKNAVKMLNRSHCGGEFSQTSHIGENFFHVCHVASCILAIIIGDHPH